MPLPVATAAKQIKDRGYNSVYCLANNAGIMATPTEITKVDSFNNSKKKTRHQPRTQQQTRLPAKDGLTEALKSRCVKSLHEDVAMLVGGGY
eukprot:1056829-Ditylum_brightwellii.AAC.1